MYNIRTHTHKKYREAAIYKENESLYYYLPLIPSIPVPTPNWHTHEYETGSGWNCLTLTHTQSVILS